MIVDKYYYWLYIVSRGLYHAIVTELRENDPLIQRHQYHQNHSVFLDFLQEDHFGWDVVSTYEYGYWFLFWSRSRW